MTSTLLRVVLLALHLPVSGDTNRRVLAVLTYLRGQQ
jgi:hypothetical protein